MPAWQKGDLPLSDILKRLDSGPAGLGVVLGAPSGNLVDIDLDAPETQRLLGLLPSGGAAFGRTRKPISHVFYSVTNSVKSRRLLDPKGGTIIELRCDGTQTVIPPSEHESGEVLEWRGAWPTCVKNVDARELTKCSEHIAAAVLLLRAYPKKGSRNDFALALAGALLSAGWTPTDAELFVTTLAKAADDEEWEDRVKTVEATKRRIENDEAIVEFATLSRWVPEDAMRSVKKWIGFARHSTSTAPAKREAQARTLVSIAHDAGFELFHDEQRNAYVRIPLDEGGHLTQLVADLELRLSHTYYDRYRELATHAALSEATRQLQAEALFRGKMHSVHLRIADTAEGVAIDLGDSAGRAVVIRPEGWTIEMVAPVRFLRGGTALALPEPRRHPKITMGNLRPFVNVPDEEAFKLVIAWLVDALRPGTPKCILVLQGEQGSAKSTTSRVLRNLIDPDRVLLEAPPRTEHELVIRAQSTAVLAYDNLSVPPIWLPDALCRLSTGGGATFRALYTDAKQVAFSAVRPIILNGIDDLLVRQDLADRAIQIVLPPIPTEARRGNELLESFREWQPFLLGALYDLLAHVLTLLPEIVHEKHALARMAEFTRTGIAIERALGWPAGSFLAAYEQNRVDIAKTSVESDPVAEAVRKLLATQGGRYSASPSQLLETLNPLTNERIARSRSWPKNGRNLSTTLRRLAPHLRVSGIQIAFGKSGARYIELEQSESREPRDIEKGIEL